MRIRVYAQREIPSAAVPDHCGLISIQILYVRHTYSYVIRNQFYGQHTLFFSKLH